MLLEVLTSMLLGLAPLHEAGYQGQGVRVAVIDAGFYAATADSVFDQSHILGTWDLLPNDKRQHSMFADPADYHGTCCLSTMLRRDTAFSGTAPEAQYYLIRTEDIYHEDTTEVARLARALYMADSLDVDVISISLGYSLMDDTLASFTYDQMDGTSSVARAATRVASHGRLICVAAGNDALKPWHYIATPADADSILTVGACVEDGSAMASFSSWGPTADGRPKPEVSAWGQQTWVWLDGQMRPGNGTSFATPEVAGMCASLISALPTMDRSRLRQLIIESASRYPNYDEQGGYGVPDAWAVYQRALATMLDASVEGDNVPRKYLRDGHIIIRRGGRTYTILGQ